MRVSWKTVMAAVVLSASASVSLYAADAPAPEPGQHSQVFEKQIIIKFDYLLSLPKDYGKEAGKKWPLILFLHGSGERGSDVNVVKKHGPPKIVEADPDSPLAKEFIVVSPQCPEGLWWRADNLVYLLSDIEEKYQVDTDRVYLTGLSMGGFGTWDLASNYPDKFAAIAPMCGGGNPVMARRLKRLPIWVFHGDADPSVPVKLSEDMVDALKNAGADVKFTKYPGVGHDCWTESYANPELYSWFLSHKRADKNDAAPKPPKGTKKTDAK